MVKSRFTFLETVGPEPELRWWIYILIVAVVIFLGLAVWRVRAEWRS